MEMSHLIDTLKAAGKTAACSAIGSLIGTLGSAFNVSVIKVELEA